MECSEDWRSYQVQFRPLWKEDPLVWKSYRRYLFVHVLKRTYHQFEEFLHFSLLLLQTYCKLHFQKQWQDQQHLSLLFLILTKNLCIFLLFQKCFDKYQKEEEFCLSEFLHLQLFDLVELYRQYQAYKLLHHKLNIL